jgi:uncharacterized protein (TIGR02145 family)
MKKTLLTLSLLVSVVLASAQTRVYGDFAYGFGFAGGEATPNKSSLVYGLPFFTQDTNINGYSLSAGVMHAQMIRVDLDLSGCQNDPDVSPAHVRSISRFFPLDEFPIETIIFMGNPMEVFHADIPNGNVYDSTAYDAVHYNWDAMFNYDSLTSLMLEVWPIYEFFDTLYLDSAQIVTNDYAINVLHIDPDTVAAHPLHGGLNLYGTASTHGCDSLHHYFINLCGGSPTAYKVYDIDGNGYASVYVGTHPHRYCWTKSNMKAKRYHDGVAAPNMIYYSEDHTDTTANLNTYGRLYNWYAAVHLDEGNPGEPAKTTNGGFVTGICPLGWHIPDSANVASLNGLDAMDLMANVLWLIPGNDTGDGFYALPAGYYNHVTDRFENMLGHTYFWSSVRHSFFDAWVCSMLYGCNHVFIDDMSVDNGASVRCVKNQIYDIDGTELNN